MLRPSVACVCPTSVSRPAQCGLLPWTALVTSLRFQGRGLQSKRIIFITARDAIFELQPALGYG